LYVGDSNKLEEAIEKIPCLMCWYEESEPRLFHVGVTHLPDGAIADYYDDGYGSANFIREDK
jgi:hypothetical protein